ncbi:MAG: response regulator [Planctomycetota bacterium]
MLYKPATKEGGRFPTRFEVSAEALGSGGDAMAGENGSSEKTGGVPVAELRNKKIFTTGEAAQLCKVSQQTIIRCFDSGRLNGFRVPGSRFRRIPREELIRFMQSNGIPTEILEGGARRILVVDDDPQILELFTDVLGTDERFVMKTAANGYDAGMLTEAFKPHLVVLDYMLPDVNGNIVAQRIREHDDLASTKIIFVSGVVNQDEIKSLLEAGGDDFVKKPFDVPELIGKMTELLGIDD